MGGVRSNLAFLDGPEREPAMRNAWETWYASELPFERYREMLARLAETRWARERWRMAALHGERGTPIGTAYVSDVAALLDGRRVRLAGIGCVVVPETMRGLGIGTRLMEELDGAFAAEGYDGALLFSSIDASYYERFGYRPLLQHALTAELGGWRSQGPPANDASTIRPFEESDEEQVQSLYNTAAGLRRFAILRDRAAWEADRLRAAHAEEFLGRPEHPLRFLVGERDGAVVSYLRTTHSRDGTRLVVLDYAFETGRREDVTAMLRHVIASRDTPPKELFSCAPTRLTNLVPSRRGAWNVTEGTMMLKSYGGLAVPSDSRHDDHFAWLSDWF